MDGYSVSTEGDVDTRYVVTNTYVPEDTPANSPKDKPRGPEVASVNRRKNRRITVDKKQFDCSLCYTCYSGYWLIDTDKKRKEYN